MVRLTRYHGFSLPFCLHRDWKQVWCQPGGACWDPMSRDVRPFWGFLAVQPMKRHMDAQSSQEVSPWLRIRTGREVSDSASSLSRSRPTLHERAVAEETSAKPAAGLNPIVALIAINGKRSRGQ
jgi:hypothetical protein